MELEVLGRQLERAVIFSGLEKLAEASLCVIRKCKGFLQQGVNKGFYKSYYKGSGFVPGFGFEGIGFRLTIESYLIWN